MSRFRLTALAAAMMVAGFASAQSPPAEVTPPPVIVVEATHPRTDASIVVDRVAKPIERQIDGLDGVARLVSRSGDDGSYSLRVFFKPGIDAERAKRAVHDRLALAVPMLPESVRSRGVTLAVKSPIRHAVFLMPKEGRHDSATIALAASKQLRGELARIPGVDAITVLGSAERSARIWLDPDRLRALKLSAIDVVKSLEKHATAQGGPKAGNTLERLRAAGGFEQLVLKTLDSGEVIRLQDVARVELGAHFQEHAHINGQPCVAFFLATGWADDPKKQSREIADHVARIGANLPEGLTLTSPWTISGRGAPGESALIDVATPTGASARNSQAELMRCERLFRQANGVATVIALTANPFDLDPQQSCLLLYARSNSPALPFRDLVRRVRAGLADESDVTLRLRERWSPSGFEDFAYPISLAISGSDVSVARELAQKLVQRLRQEPGLTDIAVNGNSVLHTRPDAEIDRTKAAALGLSLQEIADTVELCTGSLAVKGADRWFVGFPPENQPREAANVLRQTFLRAGRGEMIPLGIVVSLRQIAAPIAIERLDTKPMVRVTGGMTVAGKPAAARALCEQAWEKLLKEPGQPAVYRLTWLSGP